MACGTGKTFTSLSIVEEILNQSGKVLYGPFTFLMSQTIREWKNDSKRSLMLSQHALIKSWQKKNNGGSN